MITLGSRGSKLALWQANHVASLLAALGAETRIEIIKTTGDKIQDVPLARIGGKGLFTKEIEEALLAGTIDVAVHSMKDMPTAMPAGLTIAAIPEREEPRDALIGKRVADLASGMKIGTSSLRRAAQLYAFVPGVAIETLRGNLDTRLRKLDEGQYDAIVLAAAGLRRLGWEQRISELIPPELMCPAVGQGALAIQTRDDGGAGQQLARQLDHPATRAAVTAERALLAVLEGGCQVPIGAHATVVDGGGALQLHAVVASPDGKRLIKRYETGPLGPLPASQTGAAERLGADVGRRLLEDGAHEILQEVYAASTPGGAGPAS